MRLAFFPEGNQTPGRFFGLALRHDLGRAQGESGIFATMGAVPRASVGTVRRLLPGAIETTKGSEAFPSIYVRMALAGKEVFSREILLSPRELTALGGEFSLPEEAVRGAHFTMAPRSHFSNTELPVAPAWNELLDPACRPALHAWVAQPTGAEQPDESPLPWSSLPDNRLLLPGVRNIVKCPGDLKPAPGQLSWITAAGEARAVFARPGSESLLYRLMISARGGIAAETIFQEENFETGRFKALLTAPAGGEYCFSQSKGTKGFFFPGGVISSLTRGLTLKTSSKLPILDEDRPYFLKFVVKARIPGALFAACYQDEARQEMIGWARYNYKEGGIFVSTDKVMQSPADPERPEFLV